MGKKGKGRKKLKNQELGGKTEELNMGKGERSVLERKAINDSGGKRGEKQ